MNKENKMNYVDAILNLAEESLTDNGFKLLLKIESNLPDIWDRPSSSTGKYHQKEDGKVPTIAHHTYEMFHAAAKIIRMFGYARLSTSNDAILMGIILHDLLKYGDNGTNPHTTKNHCKVMADKLEKNRKLLMKHFSDVEYETLVMIVRYHSGQWSASVPSIQEFKFSDYPPEVLFGHMLDMLSTADCLK